MRVSAGLALVLAVIPIALAVVLWHPRSLQRQLVTWLLAGLLVSQWMHVMIFIWRRHLASASGGTELNILYFWHVPWWAALSVGVVVGLSGWVALEAWCRVGKSFQVRRVAATLFVLLLGTQLAGSSIPKLAGETCLMILFVTGLVADRFFLSYAAEVKPPAWQVQGDALTSLGLLVTVVAVLWPSFVQFGSFLFREYFVTEPEMRQLQMTRYAAYGAWLLLGMALVGSKTVRLLVDARGGRVP